MIERPVTNFLTFQVWDQGLGSWRDLAPFATKVDITRGGSQNGATTAMEVGTLSATLYGELDLANETALKPNSPIRVVRKPQTSQVLWNLLGTTVATTAIAAPQYIDLNQNISASSSGVKVWWSNVGAGADIGVQQDAPFARTEPYQATSNTLPDAFIPGETYTVSATAADVTSESVWSVPTYLVVYTGTGWDTEVIAQGAIRPVSASQTAYPPVTFTVPSDQPWRIGVWASQYANAYGQPAGTKAQSMLFTKWNVSTVVTAKPEFTGTIVDISQNIDYDKAAREKHIYTTVSAADAVQSLANTDRDGAVSRSGAGYQDFAGRIDQLASSARVPINYAPNMDTTIYTWPGSSDTTWTYSTSSGVPVTRSWVAGPGMRLRWTTTNASSGAFPTYSSKSFTNFDLNATYTVTMSVTPDEATNVTFGQFQLRYAEGNKAQLSDPVSVGQVGDAMILSLTFKVTSSKGIIQLQPVAGAATTYPAGGGTLALTFRNMKVTRISDPKGYQLSDIALQSNLANHLDIACNTVGARWWVNKDGQTIVSRQFLNNGSHLTVGDTAADDISYTDVSLSFDTKNVVNALAVNNHGRDVATGNTEDVTYSFTADSSIRRWGAHASSVDMSMYSEGAYASNLTRRAQDLMSSLSRPKYTVSQFTINVQSRPDVLEWLELRAPIRVRYGDIDQTCRILSLSHSIDPTRWEVTVEVNEIVSGVTFADFTRKYPVLTFDQFNTQHAGQDFRDFNSDPLA